MGKGCGVRTSSITHIINPPELLHGLIDQMLNRIRIRDISHRRENLAASRGIRRSRYIFFLNLRFCFSQTREVDIGDDDASTAFFGKGDGCCLTDA